MHRFTPLAGLSLAAMVWLAGAAAPVVGQTIPAFPGAEGAGFAATGGRGGDVYYVTSLADTNTPGTLRYGIATTPTTGRTILFGIGGTIELQSNLSFNKPRLTIAGQSAPGDGITLANRQTYVGSGTTSLLSDVIVRNIRFRPGNAFPGEHDSLSVEYARDVMIDHVSASWSVDETLSVTNSTDITVQWSAITESLQNAGHSKGAHGYASLLSGDQLSFHHNFFAHHDSRSPRPQISQSGPYATGTTNFDFRNNVIYNWGNKAGYNGTESGTMNINYVGNYLIAGPDTGPTTQAFDVDVTPTRMFLSDNKIDSTRNQTVSGSNTGWAMITTGSGGPTQLSAATGNTSFVSTQSPDAAYASVTDHGGARWWNRDAVDARVFAEPAVQGGSIIDSPSQVGGFPTLAAGTAPLDTDGDGMPDAWETARGLNPTVDNNNADFDADGYTDLEEYLNELAAWPAPLPAVLTTGSSARFAVWSNWDTKWQPSRFDTARINSGTAVVDAVGQDAGVVQIGAASAAGPAPTLSVTSGSLAVADSIVIGSSTVAAARLSVSGGFLAVGGTIASGSATTAAFTLTGGTVAASGLVVGGNSAYSLGGGVLKVESIQAPASGTATPTIAWTGGTLQNLDGASDLAISGSGGLTLNLSGTGTKALVVDSGRTLTLGSRLTGSGGPIVKTGSGALVLSGSAGGFSGGLSLEGGELILGSSSPLGTGTLSIPTSGTISSRSSSAVLQGPVALAANAVLTLSGSGNAAFAGQIQGSGTAGLRIQSTGTTTLAAANAYAGNTDVRGTVILGHNLAFGPSGAVLTTATTSSTIAFQATTDLTAIPNPLTLGDGSSRVVFSGSSGMAFSGGLQLSGGSRTIQNVITGKTLEFSGTTVLGLRSSGTPRTLTLTGSGNTLFSGPVVNGGSSGSSNLLVQSTGTTWLSGINTYSGSTSVTAGTLVVNGRLGSGTTTVGSAAALMGSGTLAGPLVMNGLLAPGNSPGMLTVASLVLGGSSTTLMELDGVIRGTSHDSIAVTQAGGLTYGGQLQLDFGSRFSSGTVFDLFTFAGGATGDLASVIATGSYGSLTFTRSGESWTALAGGQTLTFVETTGQLAIVPEPTAAIMAAGAAAFGLWIRARPRKKAEKKPIYCQKKRVFCLKPLCGRASFSGWFGG